MVQNGGVDGGVAKELTHHFFYFCFGTILYNLSDRACSLHIEIFADCDPVLLSNFIQQREEIVNSSMYVAFVIHYNNEEDDDVVGHGH